MTLAKSKLLGHLKKVVSNMDQRPILKCVNYNENGSIYATDSHVLVKVANFHKNEKGFNLDLSTMELNEGVYPDAERLGKLQDITAEINVDIDMLLKALKPFNDKNVLNNVVNMDIKENRMLITSGALLDFKIEVPLHDCEGEINISCASHYLINGLNFMKDVNSSIKDHNSRLALIQFQSPIRLFKINFEDEYEYLITPVRTSLRG